MEQHLFKYCNTFDFGEAIDYLKNRLNKFSQLNSHDLIYDQHFKNYPDPRLQNMDRLIPGLVNNLRYVILVNYYRNEIFNDNFKHSSKIIEWMYRSFEDHEISMNYYISMCSMLINNYDMSISKNRYMNTNLTKNQIREKYIKYRKTIPMEKINVDEVQQMILTDEEIELLTNESYSNFYYLNDFSDGLYSDWVFITYYNNSVCVKRNISYYILLDKLSTLSFGTLVNLLISKEYSKIPIGMKIIDRPDMYLPHDFKSNQFAEYFDHDYGHSLNVIDNLNMYDSNSIDQLYELISNTKSKLLIIYAWFMLFEATPNVVINYNTYYKAQKLIDMQKYSSIYVGNINIMNNMYENAKIDLADSTDSIKKYLGIELTQKLDNLFMNI